MARSSKQFYVFWRGTSSVLVKRGVPSRRKTRRMGKAAMISPRKMAARTWRCRELVAPIQVRA